MIWVGLSAGLLAVAGLGSRRVLAQLNLDQARSQGLVGERLDGLIGVVQNAPGVQALVDSVNAQRMVRYREIASSTNAPLAAVQAQAGQTLIGRAQPGWYVQSSSGSWTQR
ncbi:MAG: YdbL family protein [Azospirillaceae bacterium]